MAYFILERPHKGFAQPKYQRERDAHRSIAADLMAVLPVELEVVMPPETRNDSFEGRCRCVTVYRLSPDSILWLRKRELLKPGLNSARVPVVCRCMGTLSESGDN